MVQNRSFHLGDILSITTDCIVSPRVMDGIYDILNYMTDDKLHSNQLIRAIEECKPHILAQHPQLENVDTSDVNEKTWKNWLAKQIEQYGEYLEIKPLISGIHQYKDATEELEEQIGPDKVIAVRVDELKNRNNFDPKLN